MFTLTVGSCVQTFTDRLQALVSALRYLDYAKEAGVAIILCSPTGANLLWFIPKE